MIVPAPATLDDRRPPKTDRLSAPLRYGAASATLLAGFVQCWRYRHFMYPDGSQYLDVARIVATRGPAGLVNGYWSPLYPALIGGALRLLRPSIYWMYPLVQLTNAVVFAATVFAFDYFVQALIGARQRPPAARSDSVPLSANAIAVMSYAILFASMSSVLNVRIMSPDMIVAAVLFAVSGLLLQRRPHTAARSIVIGVVLAIGYLAKAAMFPVAFIYLAVWLIVERAADARRHALVAAVAFVVVSLPWLTALSIAKGRPTFGDVGGLSYAWYVNHAPFYWTGAPPYAGHPVHPERQISSDPDAFAAEWPTPVTYAAFFDMSYWDDGLRPIVRPADQYHAFRRTSSELADIGRSGYLLLGPVLIALIVADRRWPRSMWGYRLVGAPAVAAIAMYMIVHVEGRLIAGQLQVLLTVAVAATVFPPGRVRIVQRAATAGCLAAALVTAGPVAAGAVRHTLGDVRYGEGREPSADWRVAQALAVQGVTPGVRIAVIGNNLDVAWAQLAAASIVAVVPADQLQAYLAADEPRRSRVVDAFAQLGVRIVVARSNAPAFDTPPWTRISGTEFAVRRIGADR